MNKLKEGFNWFIGKRAANRDLDLIMDQTREEEETRKLREELQRKYERAQGPEEFKRAGGIIHPYKSSDPNYVAWQRLVARHRARQDVISFPGPDGKVRSFRATIRKVDNKTLRERLERRERGMRTGKVKKDYLDMKHPRVKTKTKTKQRRLK